MIPKQPVLRTLTIKSFRGFLEPRTVLLDASATIVVGPNGSGKTSLFDALQWLMLGRIERLAGLATRRSGDYVVSSFAPVGEPAVVSAELRVGEKHIVLRRQGTAKENDLSWTDGGETLVGSEADRKLCATLLGESELSLRDTMLTSGLLQQDVMRAVLEDQPKNRYRQMAAMLGLTEIAGFEDQARAVSEATRKEAGRMLEEHEQSEARLATESAELERLEQRLVAQPEFQQARAAFESRLVGAEKALAVESIPTSAPDAVFLGQWARRLRWGAVELLVDDEELRARDDALEGIDPNELEHVRGEERARQAALESARAALADAEEKHAPAQQRASQLAELAAIALPLLGERCPVCEQEIESADVATHLHELVAADGEHLAELREHLQLARDEVEQSDQALRMVAEKRAQLEAQQEARDDLAAARKAWFGRCEQLSREAGRRLKDELLAPVLNGERAALQALRDSADVVVGVADELAALLGASGLSEEVERQRQQVAKLTRDLEETKRAAADHSARAAAAKTLAAAATEAITGVARRRFSTLQPLLDDIFRRLDPHPVFRTLGFELDVAYRSGVADPFVRDPEQGVTGDPLLVFSSSQANVAALTYFLALSWAAGTQALPFLLLDDPLQSMDDVNALGFSDLCRHIRRRRQLVLSTHERRLGALLERKLMPRSAGDRTRVIRFTGWDRSGPTVVEEEINGPAGAPFLLEART